MEKTMKIVKIVLITWGVITVIGLVVLFSMVGIFGSMTKAVIKEYKQTEENKNETVVEESNIVEESMESMEQTDDKIYSTTLGQTND